MKRILFILLIIISLIACTKKEKKEAQLKTETINKTTSNEVITTPNKKELVKTDTVFVFADVLSKFYDHHEFYIQLYYKNQYTEELDYLLKNTNTKTIYENDESIRAELDQSLTEKHLAISNIDKLLVFNENQDQIAVINRNTYERYYDGLYDFFVATYDSPIHNLEGKLVISSEVLKTNTLNKSPQIFTDSLLLKQRISKNKYQVNEVLGFEYFTVKNDTISVLSFADKKDYKPYLYLLKNGVATDSIINDYSITKLTPIPLATNNEARYIAYCQVPDSDVSWTSLMGIDLSNYKFKFYNRNRINLNQE